MTLEVLYKNLLCANGTEPRVFVEATIMPVGEVVNTLDTDVIALACGFYP